MKKILRLFNVVVFSLMCVVGYSQTYTFTNAGATGENGPTQAQINTAYTGTNLDGAVTSNGGIQYWEVPSSGLYEISALGGQGYGTYGGRGASITGEFLLNGGDTLKILVGQAAPIYPSPSYDHQYGGGGGSFITTTNNTPLIVAGGGGGNHALSFIPSCDGQITQNGAAGVGGSTVGAGGTNGNGGQQASSADAGAGLIGNGNGSAAGTAFVNGGQGGSDNGIGGFGGGGGTSSWNNYRCGGGGGYSGGGAANNGANCCPTGGGGGSFNSGQNPVNLAGIQTGHGIVIIDRLSGDAPNDAGVSSIANDGDTVVCKEDVTVKATVNNFGTQQLSSFEVHWSVNGSVQTPFTFNGTLDTLNGINPSDTLLNIGQFDIESVSTAGSPSDIDIMIWTSLPNGVSDTSNFNDTSRAVVRSNIFYDYGELDIPTQLVLCQGEVDTVFTGLEFADHTWNDGSSKNFLKIETAGQYSVTTEDVATGCIQEDSFYVTEEAVVNLPDTTVIGCVEDGGAVLSGNVPGSYSWNTGASTSFLNVTQSGMYSVSVTEPTGKCISSDSVQVDILDSPVANFGEDVSYTTVSLTDSSEFATSYYWDFGDGNTSTESNPDHVYDFPGGTFDITMVVSNNCGTDTLTKSVTADETTGINDLNGEDEVAVYPNPTSGIFSINSSNLNSHISEIYDVTGKLARTIRWKSKVNVNVSDLNGGIYIVKTYDDEGIVDVTKLSVTK